MNKYTIKYEINRRVEKVQMWVAWRLPRWLVKCAFIRVVADASTNDLSDTPIPNISAIDALHSWSLK